MTGDHKSHASDLCRACGLCCTGYLFAWGKLKSTEIESAKVLGLNVLGSGPNDRGFSQPCSLWDGECTIYTSSHYPHFCGLYKCKLLKELMDERITLAGALLVIRDAKETIEEVETLLPALPKTNFRERLVDHLADADNEFQEKARKLLTLYKDRFGVKDIVDDIEAI
jgi:hypothetical protein